MKRARAGAVLVAVLLTMTDVVGAETLPLGLRLPQQVTLDHLLDPSTEDGDVEGPVPGVGLCESSAPRPIELPRDDGPHHDDTYLEWWWWYGNMTAGDGRRFGVMLLLTSKPSAGIRTMDYSLIDFEDRSFHDAREPLLIDRPSADPDGGVQAVGTGARVDGVPGGFRVSFAVDGYEVDIRFEPTKPAVLQLGDGYVTALCQNLSWYTRPGMRATGTVTQRAIAQAVTGTGSLDHQWGFAPLTDLLNWEWYTMRLDDGRDVMLASAKLVQGGPAQAVTGFVAGADGAITQVHRGDFEVTPTRWWQRDALCSYPTGFDVRLLDEHLHLEAVATAGEVGWVTSPLSLLTTPGWSTYWDGSVEVAGDATGVGFIDVGRYCVR